MKNISILLKNIALLLIINANLMASEINNSSDEHTNSKLIHNINNINISKSVQQNSIDKININNISSDINEDIINKVDDSNSEIEANKKLITDAIIAIGKKQFIEAKNKLYELLDNTKQNTITWNGLTRDTIKKVLTDSIVVLPTSLKDIFGNNRLAQQFYYKAMNATRDVILNKLEEEKVEYKFFLNRPEYNNVEHLMLKSNHIFSDIGNPSVEQTTLHNIDSLPYYKEIHELVKKVYNTRLNIISCKCLEGMIYSIVNKLILVPTLINLLTKINHGNFISTISAYPSQDNGYNYPVISIKIISNETLDELRLHLKYCQHIDTIKVSFDSMYGNNETSYDFEKKQYDKVKWYIKNKTDIFNDKTFYDFTNKIKNTNTGYQPNFLQNKINRGRPYNYNDRNDDSYEDTSYKNNTDYKRSKYK